MRRHWVAGLPVLAVALLGGLMLSYQPDGPAAVAAAPVSVAASAVPAASSASQAVRAPASAPGGESDKEARAELVRRMKADWCGFGAAERHRQTEAVYDKAIARTGAVGLEAIRQARATVAGELMEEAKAEVLRRWASALAQRRDVRSLAVAAYLGGGGSDQDSTASRARLQSLALTSSDPMVTALALQLPCEAGRCINIESSQWSRLEPANLHAWLALLSDPAGKARQTHTDYVLDRLAGEVRYAHSYQQELKALLMSLPQTETPGLQNEAEIELLYGIVTAWANPSLRPVLESCRGGLTDAGTASRCDAVARLLWQQDDMRNRILGLAMARTLVAAQPTLRLQWEVQAREYEAVNQWARGSIERTVKRLEPQPLEPCAVQVEARKMLQESLAVGEWERLRAEMRDAGEDPEALAARWRRHEGRSALDLRPPVAPASAPAVAG